MKKFFLFVFLFSLLVVSFVPLVSSQGTYEDYLETLSPVWSNDFDAGDWSGLTAYGESCSLITDFVNGGYYMRVNTSTMSSSTYVTPSPAINLLDWSFSLDFFIVFPTYEVSDWSIYGMVGYLYDGYSLSDSGTEIDNWYNYKLGMTINGTSYDVYGEWHHLTVCNSFSNVVGGVNGDVRAVVFLDGQYLYDEQWLDGNAATNHTSWKFGITNNWKSKSVDIYIDNLKVYGVAPLYDAPLPTPTPSPSPQSVSDEYPNVDPFVAVPSYYMVLLVLFAVVAVLAGLYVAFEKEQANKGVALLFVLVGLVLFVILIVGYLVGF